jgi:hypothetical protein
LERRSFVGTDKMMNHQAHFPNKWRNLTVRLACFITLLLLTTAISPPLWAVDCASLIIGLYTQADIDNFQNNHGPCDRVLKLHIEGADIANLDGLAGLINIHNLHIEHNDVLTSVDGLSSLTSVGGDLWIQNNSQLTNLDGLSALNSVGETLAILYNDVLRNVNGLSALTSVGGTLGIVENTVLTNVDGLSALTSVGGSHRDQRSLDIRGNDALTNLDGLSALTTVGNWSGGGSSWVIIQNNIALTNVNGLSALASISGDLIIKSNTMLTSVDGLSALTDVVAVGISSNDELINLDGLSSLTSVQDLGIGNNSSLTNVDGLSMLTTVWSDLLIQNNAALSNVNGLSAVTYVGSDLDVQSNDNLLQCTGLLHLLDQWDDAEAGPGPGASGVPDVGGEVLLGDNLAGCNSIQEILATVNPSRINPGLNDAWYNPETDGQGFFITIFPDLDAVSLAWFTYDTELPAEDATANLGDPGHRWLTAVGPIVGNQAIMEIEMTSGGLFDTSTLIDRTDPPGSDGTIILTFTSCNSATVEYDIPSIDQQGIIPLVRVANDNIVICEALSTD